METCCRPTLSAGMRGENVDGALGPAGRVGALACVLRSGRAGALRRSCGADLPVPQKLQIAGLVVDTWIPDSQTPGPWPIVLFSHRYRGCNTQSSFLMLALAGAGYAVFAPKHRDADCGKLH